MTVSSSTAKVSYSGNSSTVAFAVNFYFLANSHLKVLSRAADGTETLKVLDTDYTVIGAGNPAGGTVTMTTAPATGTTLVIARNVPLTQVTDYTPNDPFPAETHEQALDKLTMEVQQINEAIDRSIKLSLSNTMASTEFTVSAADRANKIFAFDSAGELNIAQEIGTYRSNWASGTAYKQRDIIKDTSNANIYICVTAHTSSGTQPISSNADSAKWALIVDAASAAAAQAAAEAAQAAAELAQAAAETAETNAETAETNAETAETNAETAQAAAVVAQLAAEAARDATLAAYDQFDDRYLGAKASDPTVDNDGNPLVAGALYYNTTIPEMRLYTGSAWVAAYVSGAAYLAAANNLSDVANPATARTNLGLAIGTNVQAYDADTAFLDVDQTWSGAQRGAVNTLTDGATITPDFSAGNNFAVTLGGNRTLANPTNIVAGQSGVIVITQDGTGSRLLSYGSYFKFPAGTAPTLTTTASAVDVLAYYVESSTRITARLVADVK